MYHFHVDRHTLVLKDYVDIAKATERIVKNFNSELFNGVGRVQLHVMALEPGGLKGKLGVVVLAGGVFLGSSIGAFVEGGIKELTGRDPYEWGMHAVREVQEILSLNSQGNSLSDEIEKEKTRELLHSFSDDIETDKEKFQELQKISELLSVLSNDSKAIQRRMMELQAVILAETATCFLEASNDSLTKMKFPMGKYDTAFTAKNGIFRICKRNKEIKGLNFNHSIEGLIRSDDFKNFVYRRPRKKAPFADTSPRPAV